ncbi:hypothetical protein HYC85_013274 [Camellia sinensis]|uniref:C2H2-type domain-containing protein n=1 Tax=Camellia sinensis TaxID=4442 RepID=A0A7J7H453_CAMSI|nr:hypothetical protein HYC85_013274 [Camellia sinensis]
MNYKFLYLRKRVPSLPLYTFFSLSPPSLQFSLSRRPPLLYCELYIVTGPTFRRLRFPPISGDPSIPSSQSCHFPTQRLVLMPVVKLRPSGTPDAMKSEGNDSLDTFIKQAIGKEPPLSFSRTGDNPVQWIQLLHALDQQDLPGWPLLSPLKIQMQKCEKCSREFCSPINYRRHSRLSLDEVKEIVSLKDVTLEEVPGSSVIQALTSFIRKPGFCALPQLYVKAGSALLDIIQARPSRLPISSQELFGILDDASERTFLCAGTAESVQRYVFDGEAGKIGLEMKNLVACTSFLIEQKLVRAWFADKDAEALRCQKLLVEEEEAAQKRQAELLERKRQKKLRQKEQKLKEQVNGETEDLKVPANTLNSSPSAESSSSNTLETLTDHVPSLLEPIQSSITEEDADTETQNGFSSEQSDSGTYSNVERQTAHRSGRRILVISRWQVPKSQRGGRNGFHANQNPQVLKTEPVQKHGAPREARSAQVINGNKIWTRKPKSENDGENLKSRLQKEAVNQADQNCEVMIGSISVTLGSCTAQQPSDSLGEHAMSKYSGDEKTVKSDSVQGVSNRSVVKLWRPVSRHETRDPTPVQSDSGESREDIIIRKGNYQPVSSESCLRSYALDGNGNGNESEDNNSHPLVEESVQPEDSPFSSHAAKAFLAYRWKEAIAADHVKLVLAPESEPPGCPDTENDYQVVIPSSDDHGRHVLGNAENLLDSTVALESMTTGTVKAKFRTKPEKGCQDEEEVADVADVVGRRCLYQDDIPAQQEGVGQANVAEPVGQEAMGALARGIADALRESMGIL